jgi:hypothetical protein
MCRDIAGPPSSQREVRYGTGKVDIIDEEGDSRAAQ